MVLLIGFAIMMLFILGLAIFVATWVTDTHEKATDNLLKRFSLSIQNNPYKMWCIVLVYLLIVVISQGWPDLKEHKELIDRLAEKPKVVEKIVEVDTGWHLTEIKGYKAIITYGETE